MKMKNIVLSVVFTICFGVLSLMAQQTINSGESKVEFKIKGGGIFNVHGTFTGMSGTFNFDPSALDTSKFDICIETKSINTQNSKRDEHLKTADFFEVDTYPTICYTSTSVTKRGDDFVTTGELTMHGVTKTINIPFTFVNDTFKGQLTINRFDYKIGEDTGTLKVGEEAEVTIICKVD